MDNYYHLFVKKRCTHCKEAVNVLSEKKMEYVVSAMDKAPGTLQKLQETTNHRTVPLIFRVNESDQYEFIGGCDDLKRSFEDENSSEQKTPATQEVEGQVLNG